MICEACKGATQPGTTMAEQEWAHTHCSGCNCHHRVTADIPLPTTAEEAIIDTDPDLSDPSMRGRAEALGVLELLPRTDHEISVLTAVGDQHPVRVDCSCGRTFRTVEE